MTVIANLEVLAGNGTVELRLDGTAPAQPVPPALRAQLMRWLGIDASAPVALSPRERQVLSALVDGLSYKQIAAHLGVGIETVRSYIRTLYPKLGVNSATEAVTRALREGLVG